MYPLKQPAIRKQLVKNFLLRLKSSDYISVHNKWIEVLRDYVDGYVEGLDPDKAPPRPQWNAGNDLFQTFIVLALSAQVGDATLLPTARQLFALKSGKTGTTYSCWHPYALDPAEA